MLKILMATTALAASVLAGSASAEVFKLAVPQKGAWETGFAYIGEKAGFFKAEGIDIDPLYTRGGAETVQAVLSALGLAAVLRAWPGLFQALHLAGVAYLLYLALESWRDAGIAAHHLPGGGEDGRTGFRRGLVTNLLNPKAALLFVSVLPGFLSPGDPGSGVALLSLIYLAVALAVHLVIVLAAGGLRAPLADPLVSVWMHRLQALTLAAVALWLLWRG